MDNPNQLQLRIRDAKETDLVLGLFYDSALSFVSRTQGAPKAEAIREKVLAKKNIIGFFKYPVADLLRIMDVAAGTEPARYGQMLEQFGGSAVQVFFDSPMGKTLSFIAGSDPHRVAASAPASYRACATFGERKYVKLGEKSAQLIYRGELLGPAAQSGVVGQVLASACKVKPKVSVQVENVSGSDFTIRLDW